MEGCTLEGLWRTPESSTRTYSRVAQRRSTPRWAWWVPALLAFVTSTIGAVAVLPGPPALAQQGGFPAPPAGTAQKSVGGPFDLTFNIGQQGRSGCLVCHSDKNLTKLSAGRQRSFYIAEETIDRSAHRTVSCLGCHLDFNFTAPHGKVVADYRVTAGLACRNCHARSYNLYQQGIHGSRLRGNTKSPTCSDCHGSHDIRSISKEPQARAELHARGLQVCGRCHQRYWDNYNDYYHGQAYKRGAPDSPACWQCHRAHDIYNSGKLESATNTESLALTCGACHAGVRPDFLDYTKLVHQGGAVRRTNVVLRYLDEFRVRVAQLVRAVLAPLGLS